MRTVTIIMEHEGEGDTDNYWCDWKLITIISRAFR
jgi:hypothetical protein